MYRILAVEDDTVMAGMLGHLMRSEGFEFIACGDGRSGLEAAARESPDLIILDVNLPDQLGHDVCRSLKSNPRTSAIPVIMLSGEARALESRVRGLDVGAEDYLFKPVSPKVLLARIQALIKWANKIA